VNKKKVGVLALQGDFEAHQKALERAGADAVQVRTPSELQRVQGLVIPGGESSTMLKLLGETGMMEPLREFAGDKPVFGTCAGAIIVAKEVSNPVQEALGVIDISVERNAYGRQLDSRIVHLRPEGLAGGDLEAVFIRAPIIRKVGEGVRVLATYNGDPVLVEQGRHVVATFHPELTGDTRVHELFLSKIEG
jgi:pyridoxal 5'-phosphate synthase pdxT subunit